MTIYTIGVYNSTEESFFDALSSHHIDMFCDIRQRRGVRGRQYAYVNSSRLQSKLEEMGIDYRYVKELAPTKEIRLMQKESDILNHIEKKQRTELGDVFKREYIKQILDNYDISALIHDFEMKGVENVVFFCVEEHAFACHRSLVAAKAARMFNIPVVHL